MRTAQTSRPTRLIGTAIATVAALSVAYLVVRLSGRLSTRTLDQDISYGSLLIIGLLTGFHCVGMCGGLVLAGSAGGAQKRAQSSVAPLAYALGKLVSYTCIGALLGTAGSLFIFTNSVRAGVAIGAGILMVIYGINLTGLFPWLKRLWVRGPAFLTRLFFGRPQGRSRSPLVIGLLNGLMIACGPLQAAYLTAAVSGSALRGAVLLFLFGLGTLPVMIGFGFLFNLASMRLTGAFVRYSGVLVVILGLVMLNRGLLLTGTGLDFESLVVSRLRTSTAMEHSVVADGVQTIRMDVVGDGWRPDKFLLKADVPVRWIINGEQINECNKAIQVPRLGLSFDIVPGEQVIEFTPVQEGTIQWSCWMGMIDGCFVVEK